MCCSVEIMEREIKRKEHKEETVEGGKDGGVEPCNHCSESTEAGR